MCETITIDDKINEVPTIETLINEMNLIIVIAAWNVLNFQTKNVATVINVSDDYLVPIKENQEIFYNNLRVCK